MSLHRVCCCGGNDPTGGTGILCFVQGRTTLCRDSAAPGSLPDLPIVERYGGRVYSFTGVYQYEEEEASGTPFFPQEPYTWKIRYKTTFSGVFGVDLYHSSDSSPGDTTRIISEYNLSEFTNFSTSGIVELGTGMFGVPFVAWNADRVGGGPIQIPFTLGALSNGNRLLWRTSLDRAGFGFQCGLVAGPTNTITGSPSGSPNAARYDYYDKLTFISGTPFIRDKRGFATFNAVQLIATDTLPSHWQGPLDFVVCDRTFATSSFVDPNADAIQQSQLNDPLRTCRGCGG